MRQSLQRRQPAPVDVVDANVPEVADALEVSCNVFFYTMGSRLGLPDITRWYRAFGFGALIVVPPGTPYPRA